MQEPANILRTEIVQLREWSDRDTGTIFLSCIEQETEWLQKGPDLKVDLSGRNLVSKLPGRQMGLIHGTFSVTASNVMVFGANHVIDQNGVWLNESLKYKRDALKHFLTPAFNHFFPGCRPKIISGPDRTLIDFTAIPDHDFVQLHEPVFLATPIEPDQWGRWLLFVIPKVLFWKKYHFDKKLLCRASKPWQKSLLHLLGVPADKIIDHDPGKIYLCDELNTLVYSVIDLAVSPQERKALLGWAEQFSDGSTHVEESRSIYVGRLSHSLRFPKYRKLLNEHELVEALRKSGIPLVEPETLPIVDQVRLFSRANFVVGLGGAGMFNVVFSDRKTKVISIESSETFVPGHTRLLGSLVDQYGIIFGAQDASDTTFVHKRWSLDVEKAVDTIMQFKIG